jgi:putative membrane protein
MAHSELEEVATMMRGTRQTAFALALGAVTVLGACKKGDNAADTTMAGAADTSMAAGSMSSTSMNAPAAAMSDAAIFAMLDAANKGEISAGKMAASKATDASVKSFANDMVAAHTKMLNEGTALAKRLNVTPDSTAADSIMAMNQSTAANLTAAPKGGTFDSLYVNSQVAGHEYVLDMVKRAQGAAQNADLKAMLTSAEPQVQSHLDRIKDIQGKMK